MSVLPLTQNAAVAVDAVARRKDAQIGVVHFGPGAFHRAHQAWYFDKLLADDPRWAISGVSLKSPGVRDALGPQDGLYVLAELEAKRSMRVIGSIVELIVAPENPTAVLQRLASPQVGVVTATVTEKGYCLDGQGDLDLGHPDIVRDLATPRGPSSLIGYLVEGLRLRRAAGLAPPAIISCDNLADNGRLLKSAVVQFAGIADSDLARWIDGEAAFPRTMVDSITPATDDSLRELVRTELGVSDAWPVQRERFCQWVIEDILPKGSPDLARVGAELTNDVGGYEKAKLRLLNGAHSSLAYMGLLRGRETVADAMADAELAAFVETLMRNDILPNVSAPKGLNLSAYIDAVLARFRNPAIRHTLAQIAWDGSQKLPFRLLSTISDALSAGRPISRLCLPIGAWMVFVVRRAKIGAALTDPMADVLTAIGLACAGEASSDVGRFLTLERIFPPHLAADPKFRAAMETAYAAASVPRMSLKVEQV